MKNSGAGTQWDLNPHPSRWQRDALRYYLLHLKGYARTPSGNSVWGCKALPVKKLR